VSSNYFRHRRIHRQLLIHKPQADKFKKKKMHVLKPPIFNVSLNLHVVNPTRKFLVIHMRQNYPGQTILMIHYIKDSDINAMLGGEIMASIHLNV
jgi:hypothetical protein